MGIILSCLFTNSLQQVFSIPIGGILADPGFVRPKKGYYYSVVCLLFQNFGILIIWQKTDLDSGACWKCLGIPKLNYTSKKHNLLSGAFGNLHIRRHIGNKRLQKCFSKEDMNSVSPSSVQMFVLHCLCITYWQIQIKSQILPLDVLMQLPLCP